jgi:GNAT superfamily N-acetyltransferase
MNIRWDEITEGHSIYLKDVFDLYDRTFPYEVREPHHVFLKSLHMTKNHFHFLIGLEGEKLVSFATGHYLPKVNTGFIVYIATNPSIRNKGIGSRTLAELENRFKIDAISSGHETLRAVVLETEKQELAHSNIEREECLKRTRFFERNQSTKTDEIFYLQPPLHDGEDAIPLNLFFNNKLSKEEICKIIHSIYEEKYFNVNGIHKEIRLKCLTEMGITP